MNAPNSQTSVENLPPEVEIPILYEDDAILVILKPAGLLSIADGYNPSLPHVAGSLASKYGKCWIVHRLDRETSGVMILARSPAAHRHLNIQFEQRQVSKIYHAFITGHPAWDEILADAPLFVNGDRKHRTVAGAPTGKPAQTDLKVLQRFHWGCLIEARPHTGYTHQIRAHLAFLGFPILGDLLYRSVGSIPKPKADPQNPAPLFHRVALHAFSIRFIHPASAEPLQFQAPYPPDLQALIN